MLLLQDERAYLSVVHSVRDTNPQLKKILSRNSVLNKNRMDVDCVLHLSKGAVLSHLDTIGRAVHSVVPDYCRISDTNKVRL